MFSPSNMLLKYLNAKPRDIYDIVGALEGYINADPKFQTNDFFEAINYVLSHGVSRSELFQDFNPNIDFEENEEKWNYDYYLLARVYLKDNFCEKRVAHVKAIAQKLYPQAAKSQSVVIAASRSGGSMQPKLVQTGGPQAPRKKTQDQSLHKDSRTMQVPRSVKIGIVVLLSVLLVLMIVFITR